MEVPICPCEPGEPKLGEGIVFGQVDDPRTHVRVEDAVVEIRQDDPGAHAELSSFRDEVPVSPVEHELPLLTPHDERDHLPLLVEDEVEVLHAPLLRGKLCLECFEFGLHHR